MNEKKPPRSVRLEQDVETWLKSKAKAGDRSFNAEINRQLRKAKEEGEQKTA